MGAVTDPEAPDPRLELIYAESVRRLDQQGEVLESLRNRTGLLLGAGALSTSFLGPIALEDGGGWSAAAIGCVVVGFGLVSAVLWPWTNWAFGHIIGDLFAEYMDASPPRTIAETHRYLSLDNARGYTKNKRLLGRLFVCFQLATLSLAASVAFWLLDLGGSTS
jgi:hypothetical protein